MHVKLDWFSDEGPWWGPYAGVLILIGFALLPVLIFALLNASEIIRVVRSAGG